MTERELFEQRFPVPAGIYWNDISAQYDALPGAAGFDDVEIYHGKWQAWQAARARSGQGVEPVAVVELSDYIHLSGTSASQRKALKEVSEGSIQSLPVGTKLYTHPKPAQQGNQEDLIALLTNALANIRDTDASAKTLQNMAALALRVKDELATTHQPAQQGSVPDGFSEFVSAVRSINRSSHHAIQIPGDDQPCFWQRKEWIDWILELADQVEDSLSAATPQPQGDGWIKCSERLPKLGQRVQLFSQGVIQHMMPLFDDSDEGLFWDFEVHDYNPPVDMSRDQWRPLPQPPKEGEGDGRS